MERLLLIILLLLYIWESETFCPSLCSCKNNKVGEGALSADPGPGEFLKLKCGGSENQISELKEIDLSKISSLVVNLNMSGNTVSTLSRDLHLPNLQKLDLSNNQISLIESDAFYNLSNLQRLDLSSNAISKVYKEMFKGLLNLERLIMSHNHISTLVAGTFDFLIGLKHLDISENPLLCDCDLLWIGDWSRDSNIKLTGNPKCGVPPNVAGKMVRKLKLFLSVSMCGTVLPTAVLVLKPVNDQVVFEGDTLSLSCRAPLASGIVKYELKWIHPLFEICDVNVTNTSIQEDGVAETTVLFNNITNHHMGNWTCIYSDKNNLSYNRTIEVLVLSNKTQYCMTDQTYGNKGLYAWPQLLVNHTAAVPCDSGDGLAYRYCHANATWSSANTSECAYISNITKLLQQFALLNVSLVQYSALNATQRLAILIQEKTYPLVEILDADDVLFIAKAIRNYMEYNVEEKELGSALMDVISSVMNISSTVMAAAERQYAACTDIVQAAEELSHYTNNIQGHKKNMAIERFPVKDGFSGVTCVWYTAARSSRRLLHCTTTNRTASPFFTVSDTLIHASVQIPSTLIYSNMGENTLDFVNKTHELVVSIYDDASLFPLFPEMENEGPLRAHRSKDYYGRSTKREDMNMEITSPVVGVKLLNVSIQDRLVEPVFVMLRASTSGGVDGRAAIWDSATRQWLDNQSDCTVSHVISDMVVISCFRLAYVGLLQNVETGIYGARTDGARFKVSHPAIYVGSLILLGCVSCAALTYIMCYSVIQMAKKAKHALINTWIAIGLLCFMYTLGIYQTEDLRLCQTVGLLIHYLSLSCLLWMVVSASNMYKWATKTHNPAVQTPEDDIPLGVPVQKPILGLYLIGWGIALIVCGISGAVNLKDYAGYTQCFLSTAPSLSALFVPGIILLTFLLVLYLLIRCTIRNMNIQLSEGTQATENVDLEMWEANQTNESTERRSIKSTVESEVDDIEHTPIVQLRAQVIVLCLFLSCWTCGAVAVYRPLPAYLPYQEDICSIVYAVCTTILGTFILFFYGIARSDVRAQWTLMHCYLKKTKQCCRNRSIFDTNQQNMPTNLAQPVPITHQIPNDNRSRSESRSSNRTNSKTNNSGNFKEAVELNGQTLQKDTIKNSNGKTSNINLVVLHRQQYRSNNSMITYPDSGNVAPEIFYNPNQINVAKKFFKKQRQHMKRNCLELPVRRDCDSDSHMSLPLPSRDAYNGVASIINSGSKINNTNLHVERGNTSENGLKETRNVRNPNILEDDVKDNIKYISYPVDITKSCNKTDDKTSRAPAVMNIYTNVPETMVPQHQIVTTQEKIKRVPLPRSSISEECLQSHSSEQPEMRTISQQCSLEYSSASEIAMPHTCSDQTLNTHSELTSLQETQSALCSTNEITDTESFGQYIDYLQPAKSQDKENVLDKSLQDISEECTANSDDNARISRSVEDGELDNLLEAHDVDQNDKFAHVKDVFFLTKNRYDFDTSSLNNSEQGFENESDIYCPNYQRSEVSIRSHGLYAPSPSSVCPNELSFSNEDVSNNENQYVNYDPRWRRTLKNNLAKFMQSPAVSCPDVNREGSPMSFVSELDELYTRIKSRDKQRTPKKSETATLDVTLNSDVTLKPCDSDSCVSEAISDIDVKEETIV